MTANLSANSNTTISYNNTNIEVSPETQKFVKNILGVNTDLQINEIIEIMNQVYLVNIKNKYFFSLPEKKRKKMIL